MAVHRLGALRVLLTGIILHIFQPLRKGALLRVIGGIRNIVYNPVADHVIVFFYARLRVTQIFVEREVTSLSLSSSPI
jgi:hypothetical protein